jgi:hypothetical protein
MNTTKEEKDAKADLIDKCAVYLNDNFHKFSQTNKIKISLEIFKRNMPSSPLIDQSKHYHITYGYRTIAGSLREEERTGQPT